MAFSIRLIRPFCAIEVTVPGATFSTAIAAEHADALLCEWAVTKELYAFPGPSAWFTDQVWARLAAVLQAQHENRRTA